MDKIIIVCRCRDCKHRWTRILNPSSYIYLLQCPKCGYYDIGIKAPRESEQDRV